MGNGNFARGVLFAVNVGYACGGAALAAVGVWFFVQLLDFTSLRNSNHYLLDYRVYWLQVTPWLFVAVGAAVLLVALCGFCGAMGRGRGALTTYAVLLLLVVLAHAAAAALVFVYVDGEATDKFVKDTVYDGFHNAKGDPDVLRAFGRIEQGLRCCGANDVRDYRSWHTKLDHLPLSCCSKDALATACDYTDKEANERHGCSKVAATYAKRISVGLAAGSAAMAVLELAGLAFALVLLARRTPRVPAYPEKEKARPNGV